MLDSLEITLTRIVGCPTKVEWVLHTSLPLHELVACASLHQLLWRAEAIWSVAKDSTFLWASNGAKWITSGCVGSPTEVKHRLDLDYRALAACITLHIERISERTCFVGPHDIAVLTLVENVSIITFRDSIDIWAFSRLINRARRMRTCLKIRWVVLCFSCNWIDACLGLLWAQLRVSCGTLVDWAVHKSFLNFWKWTSVRIQGWLVGRTCTKLRALSFLSLFSSRVPFVVEFL